MEIHFIHMIEMTLKRYPFIMYDKSDYGKYKLNFIIKKDHQKKLTTKYRKKFCLLIEVSLYNNLLITEMFIFIYYMHDSYY
jgi:hypothetical protein